MIMLLVRLSYFLSHCFLTITYEWSRSFESPPKSSPQHEGIIHHKNQERVYYQGVAVYVVQSRFIDMGH